MPLRFKQCSLAIAFLGGLLLVVMAVGGYFDRSDMNWLEPATGNSRRNSDLAIVYWSGDMGTRVGLGSQLLPVVSGQGIPVLSVTSPALFARPRNRSFVDDQVVRSVRLALAHKGIRRVAVVGDSFGADMLGAGLGQLPAELRKHVAAVVLLVPATAVYFAANPTGIFYHGRVASDPDRTLPLLRGLPVTCVYGTDEADSLCREPVMGSARRVAIHDGHMMLSRSEDAIQAVLQGVTNPPPAFR